MEFLSRLWGGAEKHGADLLETTNSYSATAWIAVCHRISPLRWKIFQMLCRDASNLLDASLLANQV